MGYIGIMEKKMETTIIYSTLGIQSRQSKHVKFQVCLRKMGPLAFEENSKDLWVHRGYTVGI